MEIGKEGATTMAKKKPKLAIEDYLDFIDNRTLDLTVNQLRQIIAMHGFKKIEAQKRILIDMVKSMDHLMDLHRSTLLNDGVSGDARLTLKEVINDLKCLDWQECHVTSLLTQRAAAAASPATDGTVSVKRKRSRRSGRKAVEAAADHSVISTAGPTVAAGSTTTMRSVDCNSSEL